jgi:hypothetical protein
MLNFEFVQSLFKAPKMSIKVEIRWPKNVTFALNRRAENDFLIFVVDDCVRQDLELTSGSLEKVHVLGVRHDGLAEVDAAVNDGLLLLAFKNLK